MRLASQQRCLILFVLPSLLVVARELKLHTLAKMLVREEGRRMRREKELAWVTHKCDYSASVQGRFAGYMSL